MLRLLNSFLLLLNCNLNHCFTVGHEGDCISFDIGTLQRESFAGIGFYHHIQNAHQSAISEFFLYENISVRIVTKCHRVCTIFKDVIPDNEGFWHRFFSRSLTNIVDTNCEYNNKQCPLSTSAPRKLL